MAAVSAAPLVVTVAVFDGKSTSTLSTPSTLESAACTLGGQPPPQVMPVMSSLTGVATAVSVTSYLLLEESSLLQPVAARRPSTVSVIASLFMGKFRR